MIGAARYSAEFKNEAIKQVTDRGFLVKDVAKRLGITLWSIYAWMKKNRDIGTLES
jgi:transposase